MTDATRAKLYLAGPCFTAAERLWNASLAAELRRRGCEVFLPQDEVSSGATSNAIFRTCLRGVLWSDVVVACLDGPDPDSGTAAECGFGYGRRPIVAYRTDMRRGGEGLEMGIEYNLMLYEMSSYCTGVRLLRRNNPTEDLVPYVADMLMEGVEFLRAKRFLPACLDDLLGENRACLSGSHTPPSR